jgi:hypothetical protein
LAFGRGRQEAQAKRRGTDRRQKSGNLIGKHSGPRKHRKHNLIDMHYLESTTQSPFIA